MNDDKNQEEELTQENEGKEEAQAKSSQNSTNKDDQDDKIEELTNALARAMADLQNFKRRSEEEKGSFTRFANAEFLKALLPFIDNLDRSVFHLPEELKENVWVKGIVHTHVDLLKTLEALGIKKMKTIGEKLNPGMHDALMSGPGEKDIITEEFEPGYLMSDVVIKPAKVKVGDGTTIE